MNFSSNINWVIRVVLNPLLFFTKRFCTYQKHQKALKAQKGNQPKAQNANKRPKVKNALKNNWVEKSNLFAYLRFCVFCAREEKKIENKKMKSPTMEMY